ncbi:phytosulfokines isoform X1 [Iris pallida]|uniref:Phytosulfokines isoform X1 n=1 Tax=Iris pallida TaxID=29817 RepID=A0AAX6H159_IRIPA|nr:phytosulfokines isoform X1 [Iris pallida]
MKAITLLFITLLLLATLSQAARPIPKEANSVKVLHSTLARIVSIKSIILTDGTIYKSIYYNMVALLQHVAVNLFLSNSSDSCSHRGER